MKKILGIAVILLWILCFVSCRGDGPHLDRSVYGEEFVQKHRSLFLNADCTHSFAYTDAREVSDVADGNVYHAVRCKWSDCALEASVEAHTIDPAALQAKEAPSYQENGYLYHRIYTSCTVCKHTVILNVYCQAQAEGCTDRGENVCLEGCDWEEILCDTPYEILRD